MSRAAAFPQQGHGGAGVGAGAEHHDLLGGPVGFFGKVSGKVQGHRDDGQAAGAERRLGADVLGGFGGGLEQPDQAGAGGALVLRGDQGPAHLAGDFAFADDGGVQSGADGEEVLADVGPVRVLKDRETKCSLSPLAFADLADEGGARGLDVVGDAGLRRRFRSGCRWQGQRRP